MKVTVDLDPDLYRALKVEAARADRSVRDVLADAVADWLARAEDHEDRASAAEALAEYERDGGIAAAEFFERLAAETRAAYGGSAAGEGGAADLAVADDPAVADDSPASEPAATARASPRKPAGSSGT